MVPRTPGTAKTYDETNQRLPVCPRFQGTSLVQHTGLGTASYFQLKDQSRVGKPPKFLKFSWAQNKKRLWRFLLVFLWVADPRISAEVKSIMVTQLGSRTNAELFFTPKDDDFTWEKFLEETDSEDHLIGKGFEKTRCTDIEMKRK